MKIERMFDVSNATYNLLELSNEQFKFLYKALDSYLFITHHCLPLEGELGELHSKIEKIRDSQNLTI